MNHHSIVRLFLIILLSSLSLTACDSRIGIPNPAINEWSYINAKLEWLKTNNTQGYEIERSVLENSNFSVIGKTSDLTYEDTNLSQNTTYFYRTRAYKEKDGTYIYGEYSKTISIKTDIIPAPFLSKWSTGYTYADLSWTSVQGASSYLLYQGNMESNILNLYSTVSTTSIKVTDLEPASMYNFIVVAQVNTKYGVASSEKSNTLYLNTKFMQSIYSLNLSSNNNSISASWIPDDSVDGYEIYVSTDHNSCISKSNLVRRTTLSSTTIAGLKPGTLYYVAVIPYVKSSTKTFYSEFNSPLSIFTKS